MKIDRLINEVKTTTKDLIVITNKSTIASFFEDMNNEAYGEYPVVGVFNKPKDSEKVQSVFRGGVTVHFIDQEDVDTFADKIRLPIDNNNATN